MAANVDYYDIMIIGRTGMGKSTTSDKLIIANPHHLNYTGEEHPDEFIEGKLFKMSDLLVWLISEREDEIERVTTRLKNLIFFRSLDMPHEQVNMVYNKKSKMATSRPQLISNETTKIRVLDVPGFFGKEIDGRDDQKTGEKVTNTGLSIMREVLRIQFMMQMKFKRIIYFIPERGPLERPHKGLQMELEQMVHYFGRSIFECMVLVTTVNPDIYQYLPPDIIPFSEAAKRTTREMFQEALREVHVTLPEDKPPIVFLSMNDSCEDVMKRIEDAQVMSDELRLAFDHRTCIRCGLKAKILEDSDGRRQRVACYVGEDPSVAIPYEESKCHPLIISKYWKITKIVGGIAHFMTGKKFLEDRKWPYFTNPDDEICIECRKVPSEPGCKKIGSLYRIGEGGVYRVDHTPTEPVPVPNDDQPGQIEINLEPPDVDEHREQAQEPEAGKNGEGNANANGEGQQHLNGVNPGQVPVPAQQRAIPAANQGHEQRQPDAVVIGTPDLKG